MKILHIFIIMGIILAVTMLSIFEIFSTNISIIGLQDSYKVGDQVNFSFEGSGYARPCSYPEATIYKTDQPTVKLFELKFPPFMCPIEGPSLFTAHYPSKNGTYSITVNQSGRYTLDVSFLDKEIKREFEVK